MASKKVKNLKKKEEKALKKDHPYLFDMPGIDSDLNLYELTDLFHAYYQYHNRDFFVDYDTYVVGNDKSVRTVKQSMPRFKALRKIEAMRLGARPYMGGKGIANHKPNISLGYMRLLMDYLTLPYKSVFTDGDYVKVQINKRLYNEETLSKKEKEDLKLIEQNAPTLKSNKEISDDVSDAFMKVLKMSKKICKCHDFIPIRVAQDGLASFVYSDLDWTPCPVQALDLVTEPQCQYCPSTWSSFFVIKKMTAQEAVMHIRESTPFWNKNALRWSLESAQYGRGLIDSRHYNIYTDDDTPICNENFGVKSFYSEKSQRINNISSYYGSMLVVEAYYLNSKGKVNKSIFFPSETFLNVASEDRVFRDKLVNDMATSKKLSASDKELAEELQYADILFHRTNVFDSMQEAISVIPFDRSELSLERQRGYGHELASPIEVLMRLDTSILNFAILMGAPFYRNRNQGTDAQSLEDMEINLNADMINLGDKDFVEIPFTANLNDMLGVRNTVLQHIRQKAFLGGLDQTEMNSNGRGANMANLRLVRDARVHKHVVEDFSKGLKDFYTNIFVRILNMSDTDLNDDVLLEKVFYDTITKVHGWDKKFLEFDKEDVIPDTGLPYWMEIEAIRNGGSHFGAAELVLYSEIKQIFGDGLTQSSLQALNRMGIKSVLGAQDALDILGDPRDAVTLEKDQIYRATMETATIIGSVMYGDLTFESIPILEDKDDHVTHLTQVHLPKAQEMIQKISQNEVTPQYLAEVSEDELETRNTVIIQLGALGNHIALHAEQLERFGSKRDDINQLKEETNAIMQSVEGLMNSLQLTLRSLQTKKEEQRLRLMNISPENEAEKMKQQVEMQKLQLEQEKIRVELIKVDKIQADSRQQHIDNQLSKARDRRSKEMLAMRDQEIKMMEIRAKANQKRESE